VLFTNGRAGRGELETRPRAVTAGDYWTAGRDAAAARRKDSGL